MLTYSEPTVIEPDRKGIIVPYTPYGLLNLFFAIIELYVNLFELSAKFGIFLVGRTGQHTCVFANR